ncbi:MAG: hypothetical protein ACI4PO_05665 [Faecousia sp.]
MLKRIPGNFLSLLLMIWPYLLFAFCGSGKAFPRYGLLTLVVYIVSILYVFLSKEKDGGCRLAFWNMVIKLAHIPFYGILFAVGAGLTIASIGFLVPLLVLPMALGILALIDYLLLITSSMYGINALRRAKQKGTVSTAFVVVNGILHFFFVADVISAIVVYCRLRERKSWTA